MADAVTKQYPVLAGHDWQVIEGDPRWNEGGGYAEFYAPDEGYNPYQGKPTIAMFERGLMRSPEEQQQMVFGDMLHHLPQVDPKFNAMREQYQGSMTPEQREINRNAYRRGQNEYGEDRPYSDWMEQSRLDAHLRGYIAPDHNNNWAGSYTPEQVELLKSMQRYLRTGVLGE
jgi:hypothetical protein